MLVSTFMRGQLEALDAGRKVFEEESDDSDDDVDNSRKENVRKSSGSKIPVLPPSDKYHLGSCGKKPIALREIEESYKNNTAFKDFRKKLTIFVNNYVALNKDLFPTNASYIRLSADHEGSVSRFLFVPPN